MHTQEDTAVHSREVWFGRPAMQASSPRGNFSQVFDGIAKHVDRMRESAICQ